MTMRIVNGIAVIHSMTPILTDEQSALDLIGTLRFEHGITKIAMNREAVSEDFFRLSTGLAGAVMQKFVNYRCRLALFGDFSGYDSKALRDYIYECNHTISPVRFVADEAEAIRILEE